MYNQCRDRVQRLSREFLTDARLTQYSEAILDSGAPLLYCWGFIDGACVALCAPTAAKVHG
jgi:hypothetical protein